ncbi:DUF5673 domain-containing protein [Clostridium sp. C2-6-12]|uniref:DUF5673 domain-containing protein n=1 Tax=Clostridium sp. C2-6-12 TaxID=2698832 RepID=UPI00136C0B9A|nr:DUF5673 domain-containing protein [Clostridium sp. C2-6-12]
MNITSIVALIFILIVDFVLIRIDIKNKLIISGTNSYKLIMPIVVIGYMVYIGVSRGAKLEDMAVIAAILPLAFIGNKSGITERGILTNSFVFTWDKIESYSLEERGNRYIMFYKTNIGVKKVIFKEKDKEGVKKYLLGIKKLKYAKK